MGMDLSLLPFESPVGSAIPFSHSVLMLERDRELFDEIYALGKNGERVPSGFASYLSREGSRDGEPHYGKTTTTPYGDPLRWVYAKDLVRAMTYPGLAESRRNVAIREYLNHLPEETPVALYWH